MRQKAASLKHAFFTTYTLHRLLPPEDQQQVLEYERVRRSVDLQIIQENRDKLSGGRSTAAQHHHTEDAMDLTSAAAVKSKHLVQLLEGRPHQAKGGSAETAKLAARAVSQHKLYRLVQAAASLAGCCVYVAETYRSSSSSSSAAVAIEAAVLAYFLLAAAVELLAAEHRAARCCSLHRLVDAAAIAASAVFLSYNNSSSSGKDSALLLGFAHAPRLALRLLALHDGLGAAAIATSPLARRHSLHHR
jgi:hypothetical protein